MSIRSRTRVAVAVVLCFTSALITVLLLQHSLAVTASSDSQLLERFRGAAFEDVVGFGFWPTLLVTGLVQAFLVAGSWLLLRELRLRRLVLLLALVFVVVSVLEYRAFQREFHVWSTQ
jgi:hypothetical protein